MKLALQKVQRGRTACLFGLIATIMLGLATRDSNFNWPAFINVHAGDSLWSMALYLGIALVFPRLISPILFVGVLGISYAVELSQLLSWPWLSSLRGTVFGQLFLGTGFQWLDFPRYTAGALIAFALDSLCVTKLRT